jgi:hypothetical protein
MKGKLLRQTARCAVSVAFLLAAGAAVAIQSQQVELGLDGDYDGTVSITRDEEGRMVFQDQEVATPTPLSALLASVFNFIEQFGTLGGAGTAPVGDGAGGLAMTDIATQAELDALRNGLTMNDDAWVGLGAGAGRIEFDDQATDEVNVLAARMGIGTSTPGYSLDIAGNFRLDGSLGDVIIASNGNTIELTRAGENSLRATNAVGSLGFYTGSGPTRAMFIDSAQKIGINTAGPDRRVDILDASNPQLRLTQADGTVYTDFTTDSSGDLAIAPSGGDATIGGNLAIDATGGAKLTLNGSRLMNETNLLDNPDFALWQRETSTDADQGGDAGATVTQPTPGLQTLGADRWQASRAGTGMTATISRAAPPGTLPTAPYAMKIEATAGDPCRFYIHQTVTRERTRGLRGKWVTFAVSHYLDGGTDGGNIAIYKTVGGTATELARYTFVSTDGGWDRLAVTALVTADAECLAVSIQSELSDGGPTTAYVANATLVEGKYVGTGERVTDPDTSSVPPLSRDPAEDLAACQRFFEKGGFYYTSTAPDDGTYVHFTTVHYNTPKVGDATITLSNVSAGSLGNLSAETGEVPAYEAGSNWPQGFWIGIGGETSSTTPFSPHGDWTAEVPEPI